MTPIAKALEIVFIAAWTVCIGAGLYATRYFWRIWIARLKNREPQKEDVRKCLKGTGIFLAGWCLAAAAGLIAEYWAGGWR